MASNQAHLSISENSETWGSVRVTIPATPYTVQANAGTSIACRECWVIAAEANTTEIRVKVGSACAAATGIPCPKSVDHANHGSTVPLRLPVTDVNLLYFIGGTQNDVVDIIYRV